ncbi:MAG: hypothetical protein ACYC5M_07345 [Anaerolineae bacterium]
MNALLTLLGLHTPRVVRRSALGALLRVTADAFGAKAPSTRGASTDALLRQYAEATRGWAEDRLRTGDDLDLLEDRLYRNALALGARFGRMMRVRDMRDIVAAAHLLYSWLGIDLVGTTAGQVMIHRCFFSDFYSPAVCRVMSALDRGVLAGLSGGRQLAFTARITEGAPCCQAHLVLKEAYT